MAVPELVDGDLPLGADEVFYYPNRAAAPFAGSWSRLATFSNAGTLLIIKATCAPYAFDCPRSMLGVSRPTAWIERSSASQAAASGSRPGFAPR